MSCLLGGLLSTRSRAPRAGDRSSATHRSGIGTSLEWPAVPVASCWLPRRRRACPSAALDERVLPVRLAGHGPDVPDVPIGWIRESCRSRGGEACPSALDLGVSPRPE